MSAEIEVVIKYYNVIRDAAGQRQECVRLPAGATLGDLLAEIARRYPAVGEILFLPGGELSPYTRIFAGGQVVEAQDLGRRLQAGDEVMLFPAVAGG